MKIEINDELASQLLEQLGGTQEPTDLDEWVAKKWLIRTVTNYLTGMVVKRSGSFLVMKDAAWVADTGRFMQALKDGTLVDVEPVGDVVVNLSAIVDAFPWKHALPKSQK